LKNLLAILGVLIVAAGTLGLASAALSNPAVDSKAERGKYLVIQVGLCGDCHTPHNEKGEPVQGQELQGADVTFKPLKPIPNWSEYAPPVTGNAGFSNEEQLVNFLVTGKTPDGKFADPPMPQFRFSREDASAIAVYLKSLDKK
jgi:hypothetical protein